MLKFITSVVVTFSSDSDLACSSFLLTPFTGCTPSQAVSYVLKTPVVKSYLNRRYTIVNITFKYSGP